jgi:hypothetical protein
MTEQLNIPQILKQKISKVFRQEADIVLISARLLLPLIILCKYHNKLLLDYNMSLS